MSNQEAEIKKSSEFARNRIRETIDLIRMSESGIPVGISGNDIPLNIASGYHPKSLKIPPQLLEKVQDFRQKANILDNDLHLAIFKRLGLNPETMTFEKFIKGAKALRSSEEKAISEEQEKFRRENSRKIRELLYTKLAIERAYKDLLARNLAGK